MRSPTLGQIENLTQLFGTSFALEIFKRGNYARHFELKVKEAADKKRITIPFYLSIGSEFNSAALSMVAPERIPLFAQHRCHSLYLNFGGPAEELRDELLGLPTGCAGGRSGSNSIQCKQINMFGHSGLMGEQVPIAVGAAAASQKPVITICGDASVEEDYIYPSLGWAATKKLPVLFICEDNDLSILTKVAVRRNWSPVNVAKSMNIPAVDITDDPWLIAHHAKAMLKNLPGFINIRTVRNLWHAGPGNDGPPEWDRYQLIKTELIKLGLTHQIEDIDQTNQKKVELLWQQPLTQ